MILENIDGAEDVRKLSLEEQKILAKELRRFFMRSIFPKTRLSGMLGTSAIPIRFFPEEEMTLNFFGSSRESADFQREKKAPTTASIPVIAPLLYLRHSG